MDVKKLQRVLPFTFFCTVTLFKNLILKNFGKFFQVPKGSPLQFFFHFLQPAGDSQSPKGPPFSILSLRYGPVFGRSRLVNLTSSNRNVYATTLLQNTLNKLLTRFCIFFMYPLNLESFDKIFFIFNPQKHLEFLTKVLVRVQSKVPRK